jgi:peptidoglycan/xylan/chitin deacetylase (PgdA/CDA1 family)
MKYLTFFILNLCYLSVAAEQIKQFPDDDRAYIPRIDRGFAQYLTRSLYGQNQIALTYDDGPHVVNTPKLLDILSRYNVKATFFILGQNINQRTIPIIERMLLEGHHVASHHYRHDNSNSVNEASYREGLKKSVLAIEKIKADLGIFQNEMYYRFPYGAYGQNATYHHFNVMKSVSNEIYADNCINFVFWDIDTVDWLAQMTAVDIKDNVMAQLFGGQAYRHKQVTQNGRTSFIKEAYQVNQPLGGGVVLMHDIHAKSVEATELILAKMGQNQFSVVTLPEVEEFSYGNKVCRWSF